MMQFKQGILVAGCLMAGAGTIGALVRAQDAVGGRSTAIFVPGAPALPPAMTGFPGSGESGSPLSTGMGILNPGESGRVVYSEVFQTRADSIELRSALEKLKVAKSKEERDSATAELREVLTDQFKKDIERRKKDLDEVAAKLKEMENLLTKRVEAEEKIVDLRIQVLLQDADGLGWSTGLSVPVHAWSLPTQSSPGYAPGKGK